jgi:tetratricopeptide (TPR) repeat protein
MNRVASARLRKAAFGGSFFLSRCELLISTLFAAIAFSQGCSPAANDEGKVSRTSAEWYQSAYDKRHAHDEDGAIADASEAIKADPNNAKAWLERGISRNNKKDYAGALEDINRAVQLAPEYADCIRIRGEVKARMKDYSGAIADYNTAIRLKPNFSRAYGNRAEAYHALGQDDLALADYDTSIGLDGKSYPWFIQARDKILRTQGKQPVDPATQKPKP